MPQNNGRFSRGQRRNSGPSAATNRRPQFKPYGGDSVLQLPTVSTVGVNGITDTSANVVGSINPNGSDTSWWVAYGTSLPLSPGTATAPLGIGSGTMPVSVTFVLTGLVAFTTYYVAVVGFSTAGTVYGQTLSVVPQPTPPQPVSPSTPGTTVPFGQVAVTIPHFDWPFTVTTAGVRVVEQGTTEEIVANVNTIVACVIGQSELLPFFGRPDLTFTQEPVATSELVAAVQEWEPRANEDVLSQLFPDGSWGIALEVSGTS